MKFTIDREGIQHGLARIQSIVERRSTLPILQNALLTAGPEGLRVAATDLEVGVVSTLHARVARNGQVTLGAKKLYEIVRELEEPELTIETEDDARVRVDCGASRFTLLAISPEEYPNLPSPEGVEFLEIDARLLGEMIDATLYAASSDETRYNLNGVHMELTDQERLRFVSTDGHRMALVDRSPREPVGFLKKGIIVPRKGVSEIRKLCEETEGALEVGLQAKDNFLIVRRPDLQLTSRLIDGEFPNYRQVIPTDARIRLVVERERLLHATRRISLLAQERSRGLRVALDDGQLELTASNPDLGEARETLSVDYRAKRFETGFNSRYLLDALSSMSAKEVALELIDELAPAVLRPADDPDQLSVIMPMRQ